MLAACASQEPATAPAPAPTPTDSAPVEEPVECEEIFQARVVFGAGAVSPLLAGLTIADPLGFYAEECIEVDAVAAPGGGTSLQALAVGRADFAITVPAPFINAVAETGDLGIIDVCRYTPEIHWMLWTTPGSDVATFDDLIGKSVGVLSFGDSNYVGMRQTLTGRGFDPDNDVEFIAVGAGASGADALFGGTVDALAVWDGAAATMRTLGYDLVRVPNPPEWDRLMGAGIGVQTTFLRLRPDIVAGFCRAMSKGIVFALTNPEAAVQLHWEVAPETRAEGPLENALQASLQPLLARNANQTPCGEIKCPGWILGSHDPERWEYYIDFSGLREKIEDSSIFYTNDLVEQFSDFDIDAVIKFAEEFDYDKFRS